MSASNSVPSPVLVPVFRSRFWLGLLAVLVIAVGLASRRGWSPFPAVLGNYPGNMLWAWLVFLCVAWLRPTMARGRLAAVALLIAFAVELLQLYQAPWIQAVRATTPGYLVLGNGFDPLDLLAYVVGVGLGAWVDAWWPWTGSRAAAGQSLQP